MQQEQKCVAKAISAGVSDSLFKNQSLKKLPDTWYRDCLTGNKSPIITHSIGENVSVSQSFSYSDLKL